MTQIASPVGYALGLILLAGGFFGARALYFRDRMVGVALGLGLVITLLYAVSYRIDDIAVYYIPVYLFLGLFFAVGVSHILERRSETALTGAFAALPLCLAVLALAFNHAPVDRSDYYAERQRSEAIMARLPERATYDVEAINAIQEDFDLILVITHIDDLRDSFPVHIMLEKTTDGSRVGVR